MSPAGDMVNKDFISNFNLELPNEWGMPLGWSLAFVPVLIVVSGLLFHLIGKYRGMPLLMVIIDFGVIPERSV